MARTSNLANVATVTRASKAWDPLWDFTSGGTVGTLTEYASGVARVGANGLLLEKASTNLVTNPRAEGVTAGVIGSGGVLPTNWASSGATGVEVIGTGTENGWPYLDLDVSALTPSGNVGIIFENVNSLIDDETDYTISVGAKLLSGGFTNVNSVTVNSLWYSGTAGTGYLGISATSDIKGVIDASHRRFFVTGEAPAGTTSSRVQISFTWTSGAWTFRIRLYSPQFENLAQSTSPILPVVASPAASTRAADVISVSNGAWASASAASLYVDTVWNYDPPSGDFGRVATFGNSLTNQMAVLAYSTTGSAVSVIDGGVDNALVTEATAAAGVNVKYALAYAVNDAACSILGQTQATNSSVDLSLSSPVVTLGCGNVAGSNPIGSIYIKDLRFWPRRLSNAELEALVGN